MAFIEITLCEGIQSNQQRIFIVLIESFKPGFKQNN